VETETQNIQSGLIGLHLLISQMLKST